MGGGELASTPIRERVYSSGTPIFRVYFCRLLGAHRRTGTAAVQESIKVKKVIQHAEFNVRYLKNDIALLELERPVKLSDNVNLVCLPQQGARVAPGTKCYITGNYMFCSGAMIGDGDRNKVPFAIACYPM